MSLKIKIKSLVPEAMKAKEKIRLDTLRNILSEIQYEEMQKKVDTLSDQDVITVLKREEKKRIESLEFSEKAGRVDMTADLKAELLVISSLLPSQLTESDLERIIKEEAAKGLNMGLIMKALKDTYAGQYDGKLASEVAKRVLT